MRGGWNGYQMLARPEIVLNFLAEVGKWELRHGATAFLISVGGRAFREAVGSGGLDV